MRVCWDGGLPTSDGALEAAAARNDEPLTVAERKLARLRKQVAEQEKDIAFLKKGVPRTLEGA